MDHVSNLTNINYNKHFIYYVEVELIFTFVHVIGTHRLTLSLQSFAIDTLEGKYSSSMLNLLHLFCVRSSDLYEH